MKTFKEYITEKDNSHFAELQGKLMRLDISHTRCYIPIYENTVNIKNKNYKYNGFIKINKVLIKIVDYTKLDNYKSFDRGNPDSNYMTHLGAYIVEELNGKPSIDIDLKDEDNPDKILGYITDLVYNQVTEEVIKNINYLHDLIVKNPQIDLAEYEDNKLDDKSFKGIELLLGDIDHWITENPLYVNAQLKKLYPDLEFPED
jgi:hypothetical protein